ncbi:MAG: transcription elongation factor GreA, partial [Candidatus Limnocylindrales bacterium]
PEPIRRAPTAKAAALAAVAAAKAGVGGPPGGGSGAALTADGVARLQAELAELTGVKRPEVIGRIRAAKELGDLKENADYQAAREEQSFLEGRVQAIEGLLRTAVVVAAPSIGSAADLGSRITVEIDGLTDTYTLVGSAESNPGEGRLSVASPVGQALLGATPGTEVAVRTPRGSVTYRVVAVE